MISSYINLNWLLGAMDRKTSVDSTSVSSVTANSKKELECAFRSFLDQYQRRFDEIILYIKNDWQKCFDTPNSWCELGDNQLLIGMARSGEAAEISSIDDAYGGIGPWNSLSG